MVSDLLQTILTNLWVCFLVVLFFGGSIFVHELGHFLAARRRGVHVERFSIGFGPKIFSWRGKDGVDYRVSWFPLGGYVLLPQLADLGPIEGESQADVTKLPPVSYATKMIVFVMGATFNVLFALLLACIVWIIGQPITNELTSTAIGEVLPKIADADGNMVPSPASEAGLRVGDTIVAIDGTPVATFEDIKEHLAMSSGWNKEGQRETVFRVLRDNALMNISVRPVLSGDEKLRQVGFRPAGKFIIDKVKEGSPADKTGFRADDQIVEIDGKVTLTSAQFVDALRGAAGRTVSVIVRRGGNAHTIAVEFPKERQADIGFILKSGIVYAHPSPQRQIYDTVGKTFRTLALLINPRSDINLSHLSGPTGIINSFVEVTKAGMPFTLWFTILVNVNLAVFNLLPIPVLDGGQMLFATIGRLRGRPLPGSFIMTAQSTFLVLLFSMVLYVSFFDVRRIVRDVKDQRAADAAAAPAQPGPAPEAPAPAQPAK